MHRSGCRARSSRARWVGGAGRRTRGSVIAATRGFATTGCRAWRSRSRSCSPMSAIRRPSPNRSAPAEFRTRINRFYRIASDALLRTDGLVDKFIGDGVMGMYIPGMSGLDHASKGIQAAQRILDRVANAPEAERLPVGVGVHTGTAFVGAVGHRGRGRGLHGARRRGEHHGAARFGGRQRRGADQRGGGRRGEPGDRRPGAAPPRGEGPDAAGGRGGAGRARRSTVIPLAVR